MRRRRALLALLAVALHVLAPLRAGATPQLVELCTAHGVVVVQVDAGGSPPAFPAALEHCSTCVFHAGIAGPLCEPGAKPAAAVSPPAVRLSPILPAVPRTASRPRAPPFAS